jgi:MerR family transcriptional regulator, light-induced transcriptional regulator
MISQTPAYNLMVVLKETGLKADVLRAWERRYDLPHPQRTAGGHRLYSDHDIATVKWLKNRQAEGLSISRAVQLWKDGLAAGLDPLEDAAHARGPISPGLGSATSLEILCQQWLEACLAFDSVRAEQALNQSFAIHPVEKACSAVLQHGLALIGEQWVLGKASVQQEHFASSLAIRRLDTLISAAPPPTRLQTVLVGCPPGEMHTFPALLLTFFLKRTGLKVVYLGADNPIEQMDATMDAIRPDLVVLSAQQLVSAASLCAAALVLRARNIPLAYGGLIFNRLPGLRTRIAGTFLGESLEQAVGKVEQLIQLPAFPPAVSVDDASQALAQRFRSLRPLIEQEVFAILRKQSVAIETIGQVNVFFGANLTAALELGDPALLEGELAWIDGLLTSRRIPVDQLLAYLAAYSQAVRIVVGEKGSPVTRWMDGYISLAGNSQ